MRDLRDRNCHDSVGDGSAQGRGAARTDGKDGGTASLQGGVDAKRGRGLGKLDDRRRCDVRGREALLGLDADGTVVVGSQVVVVMERKPDLGGQHHKQQAGHEPCPEPSQRIPADRRHRQRRYKQARLAPTFATANGSLRTWARRAPSHLVN